MQTNGLLKLISTYTYYPYLPINNMIEFDGGLPLIFLPHLR